ncbi:amidohydrolase family protein [Pseudonocardia sp. Ae707_Ps2]|uniref:amidohydrolase family protein n=1 Tax=Pseudonocardia sp. Ae707_Ps2 TaxID=2212992 RepID=UPI00307F3278
MPRVDGRHPAVDMDTARRLGADLGAGRIDDMDRHGIDMAVVSWTSPTQLAPGDAAVELARAANDRLATAVSEHPDRLAGFATLPWQRPAEAVAELDRAVGELGLRGVLIVGRPGAGFLDDPVHRPLLRRLADLGVPLYLHPFPPLLEVQQAYYSGFNDKVTAELSLGGWGWHHEAGNPRPRVSSSPGIFDELPGLQIISGHWGEMVPFFLPRLDDVLSPRRHRTVQDHQRHLPVPRLGHPQRHVPPAPVRLRPRGRRHRPHHLVDRLPFLHLDGTQEFLSGLDLSHGEREQITHGNAARLLGL